MLKVFERCGLAMTTSRERGVVHVTLALPPFGLSGKTLERRLRERGASYRATVEGIRRDLAERYLADTDLRLQQIAYLLGYSEPAPLVRAFKRWTGGTPMQYRARRRKP